MQGNNPLRPQILKWRKDPELFVGEVLGAVPNSDQRRALKALPDNPFMAIKSGHGTGKCHRQGSGIMLFSGKIKKVEDIVIGEQLMGDDNTPRNVLSVSSAYGDIYRIRYFDGSYYDVNSEHILCLVSSQTHGRQTTGDKTEVPLNEYLQWSKRKRRTNIGYRASCVFAKKDLAIDPYILGAWLGDGTSGESAITSVDQPILDAWYKEAKRRGLYMRVNQDITYFITGKQIVTNTFLKDLRLYNLFRNKHIPHDYKTASIEQRLELLAGLIDTDGYLDKSGRRFEITQKRKQLAEDIIWVAQSVGCHATIRKVKKHCYYKGEKREDTYYAVGITRNVELIPTRIPRKKPLRIDNPQRNNLHFGFTVEYIGKDYYHGFILDGNHRYLLGDFTVTHNTSALAWIILWFLMCHSNSRVPITAPTSNQLTQVLWPEIAKWLRGSKIEDVIEWSKSKVWVKGEEQTAFSIYRTSSKPEALQGFHEGNILFLLEEASGIEDPIWEPVEGALTTKNARAIAVGNPTRAEGNFYRAFTDQSAFWYNLTFNGEKSEQVNPEYCIRMAKKYGKESDIYRIRVLGEFPSQIADAFIPLYLCERSLGLEVKDNQRPRMGVDVARFGDNYTVWLIRQGGRITYMERVQTMDTMQIAGKTQILARENNVDPDKICIDSIGVGGGVVDRLHELNWDVKGVNVGMEPANEEDYFNRRSELWGIVKQELIDKKLNLTVENDREMTQDVCGELASPKYKLTSKGQYQLEGKEDMKKRGVMSPDMADSLCLSYFRGIGEGNKIVSASPSIYPVNY